MEETFEVTWTDIKNVFYEWIKGSRENPDEFMSSDGFRELSYEDAAVHCANAFIDYIKSTNED